MTAHVEHRLTQMSESPLKSLARLGQSPWMDFIQRSLLRSGEFARMVERWGLRGVTSNPAIFEKAIAHSEDYDEEIALLVAQGRSAMEIYEALVIGDIKAAADVLRPVYEAADGQDGFVSLEVSPHLVRDKEGTVAEARRLWLRVERPNLMIKVPGTREGLGAISELIGEGINVNVTLLFSLDRYREVIDAFLDGLEAAAEAGRRLDSIASVASFFLSRIDTIIDPLLQQAAAAHGADGEKARALQGEIAIASAKEAYRLSCDYRRHARFRQLVAAGACAQRLLWASTGTKNPNYSDTKYVEPLIGPDTVNTMPMQTLEAYDDHGRPALRLADDDAEPARILGGLRDVGVDLKEVTDTLIEEGIRKFVAPFDDLLRELEGRRQKLQ